MSLIIEIAGGSGSGKSTLAKNLVKALQGSVLITHDDYYRESCGCTEDFNYDHPGAFETELLLEHLDRLALGYGVDTPTYDYSLHRRSEEKKHIEPVPVIILEGILVLENEELRKRASLKIFVDTPEEDRLRRRIKRDMRDRGRSEESVIKQFKSTVKPMHDMYVEPEKEFADIVVKNGGKNEAVIKAITEKINSLLAKELSASR